MFWATCLKGLHSNLAARHMPGLSSTCRSLFTNSPVTNFRDLFGKSSNVLSVFHRQCCRPLCVQTGRVFRCAHCALGYRDKVTLENHIMRVHAVKRFHCPQCDAGFIQEMALKLHLKTHLRKYVCRVCDQAFPSPSRLKLHETSHQEDVHPFVCNRCGTSFKFKSSLIKHRRNLHGGGSLGCDKCGLGFATAAQLIKHLELHTLPEEQISKCERCDGVFGSIGALKEHLSNC